MSLKRHSLSLFWRLLLIRSDYVMLSTKVMVWHSCEPEKVRIFVPFGDEAASYQPVNIVSSCLFLFQCYSPYTVSWIIDCQRLTAWRPRGSWVRLNLFATVTVLWKRSILVQQTDFTWASLYWSSLTQTLRCRVQSEVSHQVLSHQDLNLLRFYSPW